MRVPWLAPRRGVWPRPAASAASSPQVRAPSPRRAARTPAPRAREARDGASSSEARVSSASELLPEEMRLDLVLAAFRGSAATTRCGAAS